MKNRVVPGGCFSYETSECHPKRLFVLPRYSANLSCDGSRYTRWNSGAPLTLPEVGWRWIGPKWLRRIRIAAISRVRDVRCELDLLVDANVLEVLVPENQYLPLRGIETQFVQPFLRELRDLHASDLCSDEWT